MSSSLFELVFNGSPIGNYLLTPTPEATIIAVNDAFLKASSRRREDLVGISLFEAFPGNPADADDSGEAALRRSLARVVETGQPDPLPAQRYPIQVELPGGGVAYEERFWGAVSTPIFDDDGRIVCISHTTIDMTEQVNSAAALTESERRYRALATATEDVVYRMSPDWSHMRQLEGRGFLKDIAQPRRSWLEEFIPQEDQEGVNKAVHDAIRNKTIFQLEHRVRRVDGTCGWTASRAVPMLDADGEIYEWIGAASDITERKEAEQKLKDADRRKDEFLAMLAHELRNPLAPIGAAAELLQIANLDEARVRQTSQIISRQVAHMSQLIDDLLDVSRVTRGLVSLDKTPVDIRRVLMEAVEQVAPLIHAQRHHLELHLPPGATIVTGDKNRLVQVFVNILNNAAKYTPGEGRLELGADVEASRVVVSVTDNGVGMTPDVAAHAFELFSQAKRTPDRSSGGLGIGLALVRSLVELHHGTVSCESPGDGMGSRFVVCLPRACVEPVHSEGMRSSGSSAEPATSLRIMVVDDNVDAASALAMLLEALGHEVMVEHRPTRALQRAREAAPQVCLLDIGLPEMDGYELARRLRAAPETASSLLIAVTGYGQESDRESALAAGFDHHLIKPIDPKKLYSLLAEVSV
ncbi:ATP-binding protein [Caballeronia sp. Lep1P3]|uniref:PAS domain-containing hybrid sensor histidine kinase/response regulator n=1 Tax=Caballeronia sp. Lep1P3 TaxID=2878150 RepID=UPI001FD4F73D|nr:ATP-binding protein [Caballeronia sp. Lep1P3]